MTSAVALFAPMTRDELLRQVEALGKACQVWGPTMKGMAELLRLYWLSLHHGLVVEGNNHALRVNVDADWAVEWLKTFRVPPYEDVLPVSTWGEACGVFEVHQRQVQTVTVFPGGYRLRCDT